MSRKTEDDWGKRHKTLYSVLGLLGTSGVGDITDCQVTAPDTLLLLNAFVWPGL